MGALEAAHKAENTILHSWMPVNESFYSHGKRKYRCKTCLGGIPAFFGKPKRERAESLLSSSVLAAVFTLSLDQVYGVKLPPNMSSFFVPERESVQDRRNSPSKSTAIPA